MSRKLTDIHTLEALDEYQAILAIGGDRRAFELLYKRWYPKLLRFAFRRTGEREAALDVVQNAALTIAKDIHRLSDPAAFGPWAYTIVRRRAADYVQSKIRARDVQAELERQPTPAAPDQDHESFALKQTLGALPEADRKLLLLFYVDGMRLREIAAGMSIPIGTVKSRLYAAREKLKAVYELTEEGTL